MSATAAVAALPAQTVRDAAYRKATARIVPILILAFLAAYLDRVNVGFAKLQMAADLKFSDAVYGAGAGIFFLGYFLFELPSNLILHRVGARTWLARIMITWGVISALTMLVQTPWQFYAVRFALGLAEAGFMPGVIYYLGAWFPADRRGRVVGLFFIGLGVAGFVGGPVSGAILGTLSGALGYAGWQWLFVLEALPSIVVGVALYLVLQDRVEDAAWLTADEKALIRADVERERAGKPALSLRDALTNRYLILMTGIFFVCNLCLYGLNFWLPTLIVNMGVKDPVTVGLMSALPSLCAIGSMVLVSRSSDRTRERRWHLAALYLTGAAGLVLSVVWQHDPVLGLLALCVATAGIMAIPPLFWNLPTAMLSGVAAAGGLAVLNSFANLSGFFGPAIIGWTSQATGKTEFSILFLAAALILAAGLIFLIPAKLVNR
ncbi:Putative metabolite transport protein NicT [Methylobacterium crusticola]|uniref:Metabolite transport protein NicT n=1 Tax=Methylobacterium crusticola TaxID=1697972 RepID=A0ABQ4R4Y1_9HYPH|nr:MFS transporter [Methylobacterium crusticola]GJD52755.1 Putative metabolite transport protein NicT [Methylobacterium crusticola]